jgi:hypothetical protein
VIVLPAACTGHLDNGVLQYLVCSQLRRFITLIDALYEHKVLVVVWADASIMALFNPDGVKRATNAKGPTANAGYAANSAGGGENSEEAAAVVGGPAADSTEDTGSPGSESEAVSSTSEARLMHDEVSRAICGIGPLPSLYISNFRLLNLLLDRCLPSTAPSRAY